MAFSSPSLTQTGGARIAQNQLVTHGALTSREKLKSWLQGLKSVAQMQKTIGPSPPESNLQAARSPGCLLPSPEQCESEGSTRVQTATSKPIDSVAPDPHGVTGTTNGNCESTQTSQLSVGVADILRQHKARRIGLMFRAPAASVNENCIPMESSSAQKLKSDTEPVDMLLAKAMEQANDNICEHAVACGMQLPTVSLFQTHAPRNDALNISHPALLHTLQKAEPVAVNQVYVPKTQKLHSGSVDLDNVSDVVCNQRAQASELNSVSAIKELMVSSQLSIAATTPTCDIVNHEKVNPSSLRAAHLVAAHSKPDMLRKSETKTAIESNEVHLSSQEAARNVDDMASHAPMLTGQSSAENKPEPSILVSNAHDHSKPTCALKKDLPNFALNESIKVEPPEHSTTKNIAPSGHDSKLLITTKRDLEPWVLKRQSKLAPTTTEISSRSRPNTRNESDLPMSIDVTTAQCTPQRKEDRWSTKLVEAKASPTHHDCPTSLSSAVRANETCNRVPPSHLPIPKDKASGRNEPSTQNKDFQTSVLREHNHAVLLNSAVADSDGSSNSSACIPPKFGIAESPSTFQREKRKDAFMLAMFSAEKTSILLKFDEVDFISKQDIASSADGATADVCRGKPRSNANFEEEHAVLMATPKSSTPCLWSHSECLATPEKDFPISGNEEEPRVTPTRSKDVVKGCDEAALSSHNFAAIKLACASGSECVAKTHMRHAAQEIRLEPEKKTSALPHNSQPRINMAADLSAKLSPSLFDSGVGHDSQSAATPNRNHQASNLCGNNIECLSKHIHTKCDSSLSLAKTPSGNHQECEVERRANALVQSSTKIGCLSDHFAKGVVDGNSTTHELDEVARTAKTTSSVHDEAIAGDVSEISSRSSAVPQQSSKPAAMPTITGTSNSITTGAFHEQPPSAKASSSAKSTFAKSQCLPPQMSPRPKGRPKSLPPPAAMPTITGTSNSVTTGAFHEQAASAKASSSAKSSFAKSQLLPPQMSPRPKGRPKSLPPSNQPCLPQAHISTEGDNAVTPAKGQVFPAQPSPRPKGHPKSLPPNNHQRASISTEGDKAGTLKIGMTLLQSELDVDVSTRGIEKSGSKPFRDQQEEALWYEIWSIVEAPMSTATVAVSVTSVCHSKCKQIELASVPHKQKAQKRIKDIEKDAASASANRVAETTKTSHCLRKAKVVDKQGKRGHYDMLGLQRTASAANIRTAYRRLALATHPDKGGDAARFQSVAAAFEVLSDVARRAEYDAMLDETDCYDGQAAEGDSTDLAETSEPDLTCREVQRAAKIVYEQLMSSKPESWQHHLCSLDANALEALKALALGQKALPPMLKQTYTEKAVSLKTQSAASGIKFMNRDLLGYTLTMSLASLTIFTGYTQVLAQAIDWQIALARALSAAQQRLKQNREAHNLIIEEPLIDCELAQIYDSEPGLQLFFSYILQTKGQRVVTPAVKDLGRAKEVRTRLRAALERGKAGAKFEKEKLNIVKELQAEESDSQCRDEELIAAITKQLVDRSAAMKARTDSKNTKRKPGDVEMLAIGPRKRLRTKTSLSTAASQAPGVPHTKRLRQKTSPSLLLALPAPEATKPTKRLRQKTSMSALLALPALEWPCAI